MAKRLQVHIPQRIWRRLVRIARRSGRKTRSLAREVMRRSLEAYTEREEPDE